MDHPAYLRRTAIVILALAGASVALAIGVDPYRVFGTPPVPGWTELKPRIYQHAAMAKVAMLERVGPKTLLLGNSRVEVGFNPDSTSWPAAARPIFNAAESGRGLDVALRMLQDAIAVRRPHDVLLGVDFVDFLEPTSPPDTPLLRIGAEDRRLLVGPDGKPNPERPLQALRDRLNATLSIDALLDSLDTLLEQNPRTGRTMTVLGFDPLHEYRLFIRRSGQYQIFQQKNTTYQEQLRSRLAPSFRDPGALASARLLQRIIEVTRDHRVRLILFIYPYHADFLEILHAAGLWSGFEAWKRMLVRMCAAAERGGSDIHLFDFSGYGPVTTEPVPRRGDTASEMRWYWESGHFKSALGDLIVRRVFGTSGNFGTVLTQANIETMLRGIRADRARYLATPPTGSTVRADKASQTDRNVAQGPEVSASSVGPDAPAAQ